MTVKTMCIAALLCLVPVLGACGHKAKPEPYGYNVELQVTPTAAAMMKDRDLHFVAGAFYFGYATPQNRGKADPLNRIDMGYEGYAYGRNTRRLHMPGASVNATRLPLTAQDVPNVMLTVYLASDHNLQTDLIYCHNAVVSVREAQARPPVIGCDLKKGSE